MSSLLAIDVSPRLEHSISRQLTARFIDYWTAAHPGGRIVRRDLVKTRLPFIDVPWIDANFTPLEQQSPEMREAVRASDELIAELMAVDHVVIGTPMFNLSIPAVLKAYIDQIVRVGVTVNSHFQGLLERKRATVILASGSYFGPGSKRTAWNNASTYLEQILAFLGIADVAVILAGKTLEIESGRTTMVDFTQQFEEQLCEAARA